MFKKTGKNTRSQALLDFILIFGILIAFLVGLTHIWIWFNANYAKRNVDYQNTREAAGRATDGPHSSLEGIYRDKTIAIDDDWVFKGDYSGEKVGLPVGVSATGDSQSGIDTEEEACATARVSAANLRAEAADYESQAASLNLNCDEDDDACESDQANAKSTLMQQAIDTREEADYLEDSACN